MFLSILLATTIRVSAAASLTDALREIAGPYQKQSGHSLLFNLGASSMLARQIEQGAPMDLFISADEVRMDELQRRGLIVPRSRRSILSNTLVIIIPSDSARKISSPQDLIDRGIRHIALAEPQTVPAGIYAMEYLRKAGVWDRVVDRIVPTDNVRSALAAVESGNADVGIVYKTDALSSRLVKIAYAVPAGEGPKISYPAAVVTESRQKVAAQHFLDYLRSDAARAVFRRYGFILP